MLVEFTKK